MRSAFLAAVAALCAAAAFAADTRDATLRVTVVDSSGGVLVSARVVVTPEQGAASPVSATTGSRGDAVFERLAPGRVAIHAEAAGFEPYDARGVRIKTGDNRRTVTLAIARLAATVDVRRDPRERASDARGDAFATVLSQAEIQELPDDPDEMEQQLKDMAGPGAVLRVNGFRGGKLPPKEQIQQIRFRRNMFAADSHEPGFIAVDIITKPGLDAWRGATNLAVRDAALNARNAFAPAKSDEQFERFSVSANGPLWRKHTSVWFAADGVDSFDTKTIVAALPVGRLAESIRKPTDTMNFSARVEHALTPKQVLRTEVQRNHTANDNLGVGDFDLPARAYRLQHDEWLARATSSGAIGKSLYNDLRLQWRGATDAYAPSSAAPAVLVLNAFDDGGAQIDGVRRSHEIEIGDDLDIAKGRHAIRAGTLFSSGWYTDSVERNAGGTFTFASLEAYAARQATTFTQNIGNPRVVTSGTEAALYVQDDVRLRKDLMVSAGARQEWQSYIGGFHLGPRAGVTWSPFGSGRTTVRAGGGLFFDWFDAQTYAQAMQLDGTHEHITTVVNPVYPNAIGDGARVLPAGRVQLARILNQPEIRELTFGVEERFGDSVQLNMLVIRRRGMSLLRGVNVNAPGISGVSPDPAAGPITEIRSTAQSSFDGVNVNVHYMRPQRRLFAVANYMLSRAIDETDSPLSLPADSFDLWAERGPSATDARHRAMGMISAPLAGRFRIATAFRVQSALPYNITTGRDENRDTISNDRPSGVFRNSARGAAQIDASARLSWSIGFGGRASPEGPQIRIVRGNDGDLLRDAPGALNDQRYVIELYAQAYNLFNRANFVNFSGVMTSPFFGRPTSALPPRRVELGARINF